MNFSIQHSSTSAKLSIRILMEEVRPIVTEKDEFEYRYKSIKLARFGTYGLSVF